MWPPIKQRLSRSQIPKTQIFPVTILHSGNRCHEDFFFLSWRFLLIKKVWRNFSLHFKIRRVSTKERTQKITQAIFKVFLWFILCVKCVISLSAWFRLRQDIFLENLITQIYSRKWNQKLQWISSLTDIKIFNRFSKVGSCGMSFCTTLLKASNIEWS